MIHLIVIVRSLVFGMFSIGAAGDEPLPASLSSRAADRSAILAGWLSEHRCGHQPGANCKYRAIIPPPPLPKPSPLLAPTGPLPALSPVGRDRSSHGRKFPPPRHQSRG